MRRAEIEEQNRFMLKRQHEFRMAADVVTEAWTAFAEVQAVAVIGSVAKALWKEVPRFSEFRRAGIRERHHLLHQQRSIQDFFAGSDQLFIICRFIKWV